MKKRDTNDSIFETARDAIDEEGLARVLELAAGEGCDDDAVAALHEVTADTLVADALAAARVAGWRGRYPTGEDVGTAAEKRRSCCERGSDEMYPLSAKGEWSVE